MNGGCLTFNLTEQKAELSISEIGMACVFTFSAICSIADIELNREQLLCSDGELKTIDDKDLYVLRWDID